MLGVYIQSYEYYQSALTIKGENTAGSLKKYFGKYVFLLSRLLFYTQNMIFIPQAIIVT